MRDLKIYTSYFAQFNNLVEDGIYPISIARFAPSFFELTGYPELKCLAPSESILLQIKKSNHSKKDEQIYTERYLKEVLRAFESPLWIIQQIHSVVPPEYNKCALLCYEKIDAQLCHRWLLADYLNNSITGLKIIEYTRSDKAEESNKVSLF